MSELREAMEEILEGYEDDYGAAMHRVYQRHQRRPRKDGKIPWPVDDGQGGFYVDMVTPKEGKRRDRIVARGGKRDWED